MIYLGLDLGSKTLGLSISDRTSTIATSLYVIRFNTYEELFNELDKVVSERKVNAFVLGNPLNLDGSLSKRSEVTKMFNYIIEKWELTSLGKKHKPQAFYKGEMYYAKAYIRKSTEHH